MTGPPHPARSGSVAAPPPAVSVIIPVLDDNAELARQLLDLRALDPPPADIVVADGAGDPHCRALCEAAGALYLACPPGRGAQLRAGAEAAQGTVLWFLHADAHVPRAAVAIITAAVAAGAIGGCFRFAFTGARALHKAALAWLINQRAAIGVPYGDQGLFATRAGYARAGGFAAAALFEEVPLVRGLRRCGRFVTLDATLGVSPRRWERDGWLRRSLANRLLALAYMAGVPPARLARRYRPQATERGGPRR
jgi:rSAM/selenodomain-associated transferase 2